MDNVLAELPFIFVYLDDVLVASPDHTSHQQHLCEVLRRLRENDLTINPQKSVFGQEEVKFWDIRFWPQRSARSLAMWRWRSIFHALRQRQRFLGLVNF